MSAIESLVRERAFLVRLAYATVWVMVAVCAVRLARATRPRCPWALVAALAFGCAVEAVFQLRFAASAMLRSGLRDFGEDAFRARRAIQIGVLVALLAPTAIYAAYRLARSRSLALSVRVALSGAGLAVLGLALETLSLHHIDQVRLIYTGFRCVAVMLAVVGTGCACARPRTAP